MKTLVKGYLRFEVDKDPLNKYRRLQLVDGAGNVITHIRPDEEVTMEIVTEE